MMLAMLVFMSWSVLVESRRPSLRRRLRHPMHATPATDSLLAVAKGRSDSRECTESIHNEREFLDKIVHGTHNAGLESSWDDYQKRLIRMMQRMKPANLEGRRALVSLRSNRTSAQKGSFKVLIVSPVRDTQGAVADFEDNWHKLRSNEFGDTFDFALFHYTNSNRFWKQHAWYSDASGPVVMRRVGPTCKPQAWSQIPLSVAKKYDYIWLLDGDLRLDYFSWDLYRTVLAVLEPPVSQPAVLPRAPGERSSDVSRVNMVGRQQGKFPIALEVERSEIMTPILSARLWGALHTRLGGNDLHTAWYLSDWWDLASMLFNLQGEKTSVLVVNAAPVRHINCKDLLWTEDGQWGKGENSCTWGCGKLDTNCRSFTGAELASVRHDWQSFWDVTGYGNQLRQCGAKQLRQCRQLLASRVHMRQWVDDDKDQLSVFRYACKSLDEYEPCEVGFFAEKEPCPQGFPQLELHTGSQTHGDVCRNKEYSSYGKGWSCPLGCQYTNKSPWCRNAAKDMPCHVG